MTSPLPSSGTAAVPARSPPPLPVVPAEHRRLLLEGGHFDESYYLARNPDIAGQDALAHYLAQGHREGRWPNAGFDPLGYLAANPDVADGQTEPLTHYARHGRAENRLLQPEELEASGDTRFTATRRVIAQAVAGRAFLRRHGLAVTPGSATPMDRLHGAAAELAARRPPLTQREGSPDAAIPDAAIPDASIPDASIIVPGGAEPAALLNCLDALATHASRYCAEIIVCDAVPVLQHLGWVRIAHDAVGCDDFARSCAAAAAIAHGRTVVVLDARCRPGEGWLDELLGHFARFPQAGLVGAKLAQESIRIGQAGQIVLSDGAHIEYGHGNNLDDPKYSFARRVDACSGAFALSREALAAAGGFSESCPMLGRETTDLALRVAASGYEVWLQPLAICLRYGPHRASLAAPDAQLAMRWPAVLGSHGTAQSNMDVEANRQAGERLLVLDAVVPTPDRDAGSVVLLEMLHALRRLNYQIAFLPHDSDQFVPGYTEDLQRIGIEVFHAPFVTNLDSALEFHGAFSVVFALRYTVLDAAYATLRRRLPQAPIIFNNVDMHYLRAMREAEITGRGSGRIAAMAAKAVELELIAKVDCTIVHTPVEEAIIRQELGIDNVVEISWITETLPAKAGFADRHDVLFLANYLHTPNVDAACHFAQDVWPRLRPRLPQGARLVLAGASPPPSVTALARADILVTGYVADLAPLFEAARVFVAPLRFGAGIKGKVIESLRRGLPCVASNMAAEGMGLTAGVEAMIAGDDASFADAVVRLHGDERAWAAMQAAGYRFVERNYSSERGQALVRQALAMADAAWIARAERRLKRRLDALRQDDTADD